VCSAPMVRSSSAADSSSCREIPQEANERPMDAGISARNAAVAPATFLLDDCGVH
jgi:hypothetical protein